MPYVPTPDEARRLRAAIDRAAFSEAERIMWLLAFAGLVVLDGILLAGGGSWVGILGAIGGFAVLYWRHRRGRLLAGEREHHREGARGGGVGGRPAPEGRGPPPINWERAGARNMRFRTSYSVSTVRRPIAASSSEGTWPHRCVKAWPIVMIPHFAFDMISHQCTASRSTGTPEDSSYAM